MLPDAGGVVHAGQVEGGVLVAPVEGLNAPCHGQMNCKDTEPYMSAFLLKLTCYQTLRHVFNRFYRLEIHSLMVGIFDPACEL